MTVNRGLALFLTVVAAGALVSAAAPPGTPSAVKLKAISARVNTKGASLVIEASEPVAYATSRPDSLTVLLDFRNVAAKDVANSVAADVKSPIARVSVEAAESLGAPTSRVRIALSQPVAHHVRSDRNSVIVDFDRPSAKAVPYVLPPASRTNSGGPAPDAMLALKESPAPDPIAVLGLDGGVGGPSASSAAIVSAPPIPQPVVIQGASPVAARLAAGLSQTPEQAQPPQLTPPQPQAPLPPSTQPQSPQPQSLPAPVPQPPSAPTPLGAARQYTGHPVSLDFQGADLRAVLRTFAEISGLNMVIDPKVTGTVDVALRDVPWDQALDIILRANGLDSRIDGTIVRIAPREIFTAEDKSRSDAAEARAAIEQLTTMTRRLSYANGLDIVKLLTSTRTLTRFGQVQVDVRTNTLIVTDLPGQIAQVEKIIDTLDTAQPQVEIEARIVNTNRNYARTLGVQWGFGGRVDPSLGNTTNLAFPNNGSLGGRAGATQGPASGATTGVPTGVNLGVSNATSAVGLALGSVNGAFNLDVALSALESSGNGRILSTPRITTQNNVEAEITQGVKLPVPSPPGGIGVQATTTYIDAALSLKVTPQISAAGTVIMKIAVDNGSPGSVTANGIAINTQRASTTLLVGDGQTTVIGGIYSSTNTASTDSTPGLGQIPLLKWLFKRDNLTDSNTELLIFITPRIIKS